MMKLSYEDAARFHGHDCPGMAVGVRVAELAVARLGRHGPGNELVAAVETDSCALDAIQVLTGCTAGRRNLVHRDHGKLAFSFWRRGDGAGLRISARAGSDAYRDDQTWALAALIEQGSATEDERALFATLQQDRVQRILAAPIEEILVVDEPSDQMPDVNPVRPSAPCEGCGDLTSTTVLHDHRGRMLCPPCHLDAHGGVLPPDHAHHGYGSARTSGHDHHDHHDHSS
jgi:formylmethanofuran dehydrogenase subunit E